MLKRILTGAAVMKMLFGFTLGLYLFIYPLTFGSVFEPDPAHPTAAGHFLFIAIFVFEYLLEALIDGPLGAFADIKGYKPTLEGSFIFRGLFFLGMVLIVVLVSHGVVGLSAYLVAFLSYGLFFAISLTLWSGANSALLYDSLAETQDQESYLKYFSRLQTGYYICLIGGALLGAYLYFAKRSMLAYGLGAIFSFIGAFFIRVYVPEPIRKRERSSYRKQIVTVMSDAWRYCLNTQAIFYILQLGAFLNLLLQAVNYTWPPYAKGILGIDKLNLKWTSIILVMTLGSLAGNVYIGSRWKKNEDNEMTEWRHYLLVSFWFGIAILTLSILAISGYNSIVPFLVLLAVARIAFGAKDAPYEALMNRMITRVSNNQDGSRPAAEVRATILSFASIFNAVLILFFFLPTFVLWKATVKGWILPAALLVIATITTHRRRNESRNRKVDAGV